MSHHANPIKTAAREVKSLLRYANGCRVKRSFLMRYLEISPELLVAALDHIQAEGKVKIMRFPGQDGSVALA